MKKFLTAIANGINLPKHISNHLFGKNHSKRHRVIVGIVIAGFGMWLSHRFAGPSNVGLVSEFIGVTLHGIGITPIIETIAEV